jgi:hypothetical protein
MTLELLPIERPNGKIYRPRKIRAIYCENHHGQRDSVIVLGTHDVIGALDTAALEAQYRAGHADILIDAVGEIGWWREAIERGERVVIDDDVRGAAGVRYEFEER